nr:MAG TPA: hypothetical protein [Caudoviricetes sp.]
MSFLLTRVEGVGYDVRSYLLSCTRPVVGFFLHIIPQNTPFLSFGGFSKTLFWGLRVPVTARRT